MALFKRKRKAEPRQIVWTAPSDCEHYVGCRMVLDEPAVLIAGATGSGKSVYEEHLLQTLMTCKVPSLNCSSGAVMWLADPKRVQLRQFVEGNPFVKNGGRYADTLESIETMLEDLVAVMDERYAIMQAEGVTDWQYGHIYCFIDELADLMISAKARTTKSLTKLLQLCRASGIHMVMLTQCPNRTVISAPIQCNVTASVALRCRTAIESRQIIGRNGAELLPKHGKVLFNIGCEKYNMDIPMVDRGRTARLIGHWHEQAILNGVA